MIDAEKIAPLRGADRVRLRTTLVFGSDDGRGAEQAFRTLLFAFLSEPLSGCELKIALLKDLSVAIESIGKALDIGTVENPAWYKRFCELPLLPRDVEPSEEECLNYDLTVVQLVCEYMKVAVNTGDKRMELSFEGGEILSALREFHSSDKRSTSLSFRLDSKVFSDRRISESFVRSCIEELEGIRPEMKISLTVEE